MDRNLGALETDYTLPASRGLYYQWGRKDPFPYPATATDAYIQAPTVYAAGFEYAESDPRTSGTESPYDVMTLEWATAHPTTYMDGVSFEDWEEWASSLDWLCDHTRTSGATSRPGKTISAAPAINPFTIRALWAGKCPVPRISRE